MAGQGLYFARTQDLIQKYPKWLNPKAHVGSETSGRAEWTLHSSWWAVPLTAFASNCHNSIQKGIGLKH